jgi:transcription elongation factor
MPEARRAGRHASRASRRASELKGSDMEGNATPGAAKPGEDTATGTDPEAKYDTPGYEDKSFGQAVNHDQDLVEELLEETDGDVGEAERRFADESAGSPALARQNDTQD